MAASGFRHQMGLRRLEQGQWLELDHAAFAKQVRQKAELMNERPDELFIALPGFEDSAIELLSLIDEEHQLQGKSTPNFDADLHTLDAAGRTVREDLCVHNIVEGALVLVGGSVCFPTRWTLSEKIGQPISAIHQPVPGLAEDIGSKIDSFVSRLRPGSGSWRTNWSLLPTDELCLPGHHRDLPIVTSPDGLFFRSERQTLRRLPATNAVVFTIAIDITPLAAFAEDRPAATTFADVLASLPAEFLSYKGLTTSRDDIVSFLRSA